MPLAHSVETLGLQHTARSKPGNDNAIYMIEVFIKACSKFLFQNFIRWKHKIECYTIICGIVLAKPLNYNSCSFSEV